jgi:signal transduction histidine kinase/HAMP domain-containing protein
MLAANLTTQVRAIAEVATAVTQGDLTRSIQVDARGEVADLKDNINAMIGNLRATTLANTEQDWLKTNLAKFSRMMQGQRDLTTVAGMLLSELAPLVNAHQGVMYLVARDEGGERLKRLAGYADMQESGEWREYRRGEGLVGQCAQEGQRILLKEIPPDLIRVHSGLMVARPSNIIVLPVLFEGQVKAVIELASLREFTPSQLAFLEQLTGSIGVVLNTIEATMRTEGLLIQSQQLAQELQTRQNELEQTNDELGNKARLLAEQNVEVERKNKEIEFARRAVEEKAAELALTSRYKSEFLANMSHELRTPLNSILILGEQLAENAEGNLSDRQVEFARTIHGAGTDLVNLISDILDLSKIESGTVTVEAEEVQFTTLRDTIERMFRHEAESRKLSFSADFSEDLERYIRTDPKRLLQVVKNLLSNALKFTERGAVKLRVGVAAGGWGKDHPILSKADTVIEFVVSDTGVGIPPEKQKIIFEAFQAGRRGHGAQVRRHGPRSRDQPRARAPARRRDPPAQRPGPRQHLHALPAAQLHGPGLRARDQRPCERAPGRPPADRPARAARGAGAGRSRGPPPRRYGATHRRGRSALRARAARPRARPRLQGTGRAHGRRRHRLRQAPCPGRDLARRLPARHARLDDPLRAEARPGDAAHPGADRDDRGGAAVRPRARRLFLPQQAAHDERPRGRVRPAEDIRHAARPRAPCRRGRHARPDERRRATRPRRRERQHRGDGHRRPPADALEAL